MATVLQVTGLARSGTAFLSTLLNLHPRAFSFHDIISDVDDWKGALAQAQEQFEFVGDCGTYQYLPGAVIEGSRKVFIDRDPESSRQAAEVAFGYDIPQKDYSKAVEASRVWIETHQPLVVPFNDVWTVKGLNRIWSYCFQADSFPKAKAEQLLKMLIQRINAEQAFGTSSLSNRVATLF
jgi:hypothetical protein